MNNKAKFRRMVPMALFGCAMVLGCWKTFGLGSDHPNDRPAHGDAWPQGMTKLVNITNRVHGFFVDAEDVFFFSGSAADLTAFLRDYSQIKGIEKHCLILHAGVVEAKSPWAQTGPPCDWMLDGCPQWYRKAARVPGYVLEVDFWTGGRIDLNKVTIPENVEVKKGSFQLDGQVAVPIAKASSAVKLPERIADIAFVVLIGLLLVFVILKVFSGHGGVTS